MGLYAAFWSLAPVVWASPPGDKLKPIKNHNDTNTPMAQRGNTVTIKRQHQNIFLNRHSERFYLCFTSFSGVGFMWIQTNTKLHKAWIKHINVFNSISKNKGLIDVPTPLMVKCRCWKCINYISVSYSFNAFNFFIIKNTFKFRNAFKNVLKLLCLI